MEPVKQKIKRKQYTHTDFKEAIRKALNRSNRKGKATIKKVAREHGIPYRTILKKLKQIKEEGNSAYLDSTDSNSDDDKALRKRRNPTKVEIKPEPKQEPVQEDQKPEMLIEAKQKRKADCCVACLKKSDELIPDPGVAEGLNLILGFDLEDPYGLEDLFCVKCRVFIREYQKFREVCLKSQQHLVNLKQEHSTKDNIFVQGGVEAFLVVDVKKERESDTEVAGVDHDSCGDEDFAPPPETKTKSKLKSETAAEKPRPTRGRKKETKWCSICETNIGYLWVPHLVEKHVKELKFEEYQCKVCDKHVKRAALTAHFEAHIILKEPMSCKVCGKEFHTLRAYKIHAERHLSFECHHCGKVLKTRMNILNHIQQVHFGAKRCYICSALFTDEAKYWAHMEEEKTLKKKQKEKICHVCGQIYNSAMALLYHVRKNHQKSEVVCNECGKKCDSWESYLMHRRYNHTEKTIKCEHCGMMFQTQGLLTTHVKLKHTQGLMVHCDVCGKTYHPLLLRKHKLMAHFKQADIFCTVCGMGFKNNARLRRHMFTHGGDRPYNCHLCSASHYQTDLLRMHYEKAHGLSYSTQEVLDICVKLTSSEYLPAQPTPGAMDLFNYEAYHQRQMN